MEKRPGAMKLKNDAVPTVFVSNQIPNKRKISLERAARNDKRRVRVFLHLITLSCYLFMDGS